MQWYTITAEGVKFTGYGRPIHMDMEVGNEIEAVRWDLNTWSFLSSLGVSCFPTVKARTAPWLISKQFI